jgi:hypothetical protein
MKTKRERLIDGETFVTSEKGNSMVPKIYSGQKVVLAPAKLEDIKIGDIVYCKIRKQYYMHLVTAIDLVKGLQISNNHGHVNGWTKKVYGKVIEIL